MFVGINFLAVVACTALSIVIGWVWFGMLFRKRLDKWEGRPDCDAPPPPAVMAKSMIIGTLGSALLCFVVALCLVHAPIPLGTDGSAVPQYVAFWLWAGFCLPFAMNKAAWEMKNWKVVVTYAGYEAVRMAIICSIFWNWR